MNEKNIPHYNNYETIPCILFTDNIDRMYFFEKTGPPHIVFVLIDDMGWKDMGCSGSGHYETPNIDGLYIIE